MTTRVPTAIASLSTRVRRAIRFLTPKVPDIADLFMALVIIATIGIALLGGSFLVGNRLLAASVIGYALSFLLASRSLRSRPDLGVQRFFISLCALVSSVWLFELVWSRWGFDRWDGIPEQLLLLSTDSPWPLGWGLLMVSLVLAGRRYLRVNRLFLVLLIGAIASFFVWKWVGFPRFDHPEWWPSKSPMIPLIPIGYSHPTHEPGLSIVAFWGALLDSIAKVFWCALPGALFVTRENMGDRLRTSLRAPRPALRRLFLPWTDWSKGLGAAPPPPSGAEAAPEETPRAAPRGRDEWRARGPWRGEPSSVALARRFVRTKLADLADLFMVATIVWVTLVAVTHRTIVVQGQVVAASIDAYAIAYLIASRSLRRVEAVGWERIPMAACAMVSGIWLFEVIAHYGWIESWSRLGPSLVEFDLNLPALREPFPLPWGLIMIGVGFVGARHMRVTRPFLVVAAAAAVVFAVWLAAGYPSFRAPFRSPQGTELFELIPPPFEHPRQFMSAGWRYIAFWGAMFAMPAKFLVCALPALLYVHHLKPRADAPQVWPDDPLLRAWKWFRRHARHAPLVAAKSS